MTNTLRPRRRISKEAENHILLASMRRCCLCYFLDNDKSVKRGQIAHLNRIRSDSEADNLVFLCLDHHDDFDSPRSQSKGLQPHEIRAHRNHLYEALKTAECSEIAVESEMSLVRDNLGPSEETLKKLNFPDSDRLIRLMREPWHLPWQRQELPELFAYKSSNGCDGICRIERIELDGGRTVIICEEIEENPGNSVTNAIEEVAFQICYKFDISPDKLVLIEHYEIDYGLDKDEWHLVKFEEYPPNSEFKSPSWIELTLSQWKALGFMPRHRAKVKLREQYSLVERVRT
jgi:hypothetical protein